MSYSDQTLSSAPPPIGVLLMAYGTPENLDQMADYLLDVREGRPPSQSLLADITSRYERIGGRSPLLDRTREQAQALEAHLNQAPGYGNARYRTFVGMRHWSPRIGQALEDMAAEGVDRLVALVMAPHSSRLSTGKYFQALDAARQTLKRPLQVAMVESWHDHPGLVTALAGQARLGLDRFQGATPYVLFTAHSLPARLRAMGDPYEEQLHTTALLVADRLGLEEGRWEFCFQSAGASGGPWMGPQVEQVVEALAAQGERRLLVVPVGFVCDHVEVLYDIDIACRALAERHGARLERSPALNADPRFIAALADIVKRAAQTIHFEREA